MEVRLLAAGDEAAAEALLLAHADSSMSLLASLRRAGLQSASFAGAFESGTLVGVAAHASGGQLYLQAPRGAALVAAAAVKASGRAVAGILGPWEQARAAREALGLDSAKARIEEREILFGLELSRLRVPEAMRSGAVVTRAPREEDLEQVVQLHLAYLRELELGVPDGRSAELVRASFPASSAAGNLFVALVGHRPVSLTSFNARLPDRVQVAGVYTLPALRGLGLARCAVAGHLLQAREAGAKRSVLFTRAVNLAAQRSYIALGYEPIGDYAVIVF